LIAHALLCAVLAVATCCGADLYLVAGTVTNALTRSPLPHAQVYIYKSGTARPSNPYITGPDGRFSFNLPAGSYALHAGVRGTTGNYGSRNDESPVGSAVIVGPGKDTTNLVFRFFPPASISGKVLDDSGEPVDDALVQLIRTSIVAGVRQTAVFRYTRTNDLGGYRLGWIPGGTGYYVTVTGEPWFTKRAQMPGVTGVAPESAQAYGPVYYPGTSDASQAAAIKIGPGEGCMPTSR